MNISVHQQDRIPRVIRILWSRFRRLKNGAFWGTYDVQAIRYYVNGELAAEKAVRGERTMLRPHLYLGMTIDVARTLDGALADVRLYSQPLTAAQMKTAFEGDSESPKALNVQFLASLWSGKAIDSGTLVNLVPRTPAAVFVKPVK